jgi:hypothetical protein
MRRGEVEVFRSASMGLDGGIPLIDAAGVREVAPSPAHQSDQPGRQVRASLGIAGQVFDRMEDFP